MGLDRFKNDGFRMADRRRFNELCMNILYSNNPRVVYEGYQRLFTDYKFHLVYGASLCSISLFEDVVMKLLQDEDEDIYTKYGWIYTPFDRFVALVDSQDMMLVEYEEFMRGDRTNCMFREEAERVISHPCRKLSNYLYMYLLDHPAPLKSRKMKDCIYKNFVNAPCSE